MQRIHRHYRNLNDEDHLKLSRKTVNRNHFEYIVLYMYMFMRVRVCVCSRAYIYHAEIVIVCRVHSA